VIISNELSSTPSYLQSQITVDQLNDYIQQLNSLIATKTPKWFAKKEVETLFGSTKSKLVLLLLMTLKRITTVSGASSLSDTTYMPI
jgi:hypothetical protein